MIDQNTMFSTLKKCNQIGKKLSYEGTYILVSGMMMGYTEQNMDDVEARGICISFIETKLLTKLDALAYIGIKINGNELYQAAQDYQFKDFTIDKNYLYINFNATEATDESFNTDFKTEAIKNGYSEETIDIGLSNNFNNDIDLYEFFIKYKKTYEPKVKSFIKSIKCKIISENNKIYKKCNKLILDINGSNFLGYKELQPEIFERIFLSSQPIEMKLDTQNEEYMLRLMKSLFVTATAKSQCELRLLRNGNLDYLIIEVGNSGFITCCIYRIINI